MCWKAFLHSRLAYAGKRQTFISKQKKEFRSQHKNNWLERKNAMDEVKEENSLSVIRLSEPSATHTALPPANGTRKKLVKLEAIRGFAALYVVCHHTLPKSTFLFGHEFFFFRYGQEAVILFFILSGFVIQNAFATSSDQSFKSFFLKRFLRIYIPLLFVFAAHFAMVTINHYHFTALDWKSLFGNLLMTQQVSGLWRHPVSFSPFLGNLPLWSLSFEWWFYMIFFFASSRLKNRASYVVYATGMAASLAYLFYPDFIVRELMYLVIWWAGVDIAKLYINKRDISLKNIAAPLLSLGFITAVLACNILLYKQQKPNDAMIFVMTPIIEVRHFGFSIVALIAAICWRKLNWAGFKYTFGLFEWIAPISFSLYISHWFLISNAVYLDGFIGNVYIKSAVYFAICCIFCYVVERLIYPYLNKRILAFFAVEKKPFVAVE